MSFDPGSNARKFALPQPFDLELPKLHADCRAASLFIHLRADPDPL